MTKFTYEASDAKGAIIRGDFDAVDRGVVYEYLSRKNLIPVSIKEKEKAGGGNILSVNIFERVTTLEQIVLVRNLAATVRAGLSILESLDILIADAGHKTMRGILVQAKSNLQNGQPLSFTFNFFKKYFPPVFIGMVRAGEVSGHLDDTLDELGHHLDREYGLTKKIKSSMAYPLVLLAASSGIVALMLVFVLPRLAKTFSQSGVELPTITKAVIGVSSIISYSFLLDILLIGSIIWLFTYFRKTDTGRHFFARLGFNIPVIRDLIKKVALVRVTRTIGSLIGSGVPIIEALSLASEAVGNEYYRVALLNSVKQIKNGVPLSKSMSGYPKLFPRFLTSLVVVGERTGTLEQILKTFAGFYDEEIDSSLKDLTTYMEPILMLFMGLMIGAIVLAILLPIYQLVGQFT